MVSEHVQESFKVRSLFISSNYRSVIWSTTLVQAEISQQLLDGMDFNDVCVSW